MKMNVVIVFEFKTTDDMMELYKESDTLKGFVSDVKADGTAKEFYDSLVEKGYANGNCMVFSTNPLAADDVKTARAYKSGNYTVVEMTMIEQVDGIHGDAKEGTVGHAISVVGDMSVIEEELPMFTIDFENSDLSIRYKNPTLKVKINDKGVIEKGTWSYDVVVNLTNLYIKNNRLPIELTIRSGYGSVAYLITTGGGF
jgi:hypothetical protein